MGETTAISWCDRTWSPWYGCTQVSLGAHGACVGCYARQISETRQKRVVFGGPGRGDGTRDFRPDGAWKEPLRWERDAAAEMATWTGLGSPPSCFVFPSMCDPFDNHPALREERRRFFDLIRATPHLTWLLLTKRPQNIRRLWMDADVDHLHWPRNAAIGFTAVTQAELERDAPFAIRAKADLHPAFLFVSIEPQMEAMDARPYLHAAGIDWVIAGGETDQGAHRARPSHPDWFRSLRDQCAASATPLHFKQWGEFVPDDPAPDAHTAMKRVGKKTAGRLLDGVQHDARPEVL